MPPLIDKTASIIELIAVVQHAMQDHPEDYCHAYAEHLTEAMTKAAALEADYWKVVTDLHAEQEKNDRWIALNQSQGRELAALRTDLAAERKKVERLHAENEYNIRMYEQRIEELTRQIIAERVLLNSTRAELADTKETTEWRDREITTITDECEFWAKRAKKAEEALRWRKWPEDKPAEDGSYLLRLIRETGYVSFETGDYYCDKSFWIFGEGLEDYDITHWLPIPPMEDE